MRTPIVVGVALREDDGPPVALGRELARLTGAPLALVHAHPFEPLPGTPMDEYRSRMDEPALAALEDVAAPLRSELEVTVRAGAGTSPAAVLHDAAHALDASAVVVGSTHRGRAGRVMPGSVGARLLHGSPCGVFVAPRGYGGADPIRRIGVGFVDTPEGRDAIAAAVLLAGLCGASVHVYTVHTPVPPGSALAVPGWLDPADVEKHRRAGAVRMAERARAMVPAELLEDAEVIEGHAADALIAVSTHMDLLVCGSRGYGPVRAVVLGGVSRGVVDGAACPVLVLPRVAGEPLARLVDRRGRPVGG